MPDALPAFDQHDIFGVIVAQHRDRTEAVGGNRRQHFPPGRPDIRRCRRPAPTAGQYQSVNSFSSASHWSSPCDGRPGHRRMPVQVDQDVGRKLIQFPLTPGVRRRASPRSRAPPKSPSRSRPLSRSRARISGALRPHRRKPFGNGDERPRIFVRRRRVHQYRGAIASTTRK